MRRGVLAVIAAAVLGSYLLTAAPARAEFGAIAYDDATGRAGWSVHQPTAQRAEEAAISNCGASDCKVAVKIGPRMCGALARVGEGKHVGAASRPARDAARLAALTDCRKANLGECVVRFSECNK